MQLISLQGSPEKDHLLMSRYVKNIAFTAICAATLVSNAFGQKRASARVTASASSPASTRIVPSTLAQLNQSLQQLVKRVSPAVVQIEVSGFGAAQESNRRETALIVRQHGIGSGVIVAPDGYIMTNAHVIDGAQKIRVVMMVPPTPLFDVSSAGRTVLDAKVVGVHRESDLALLKVEATNLPALNFRVDPAAQPGELVFAIGSPEGLQNSATMGVISAALRQPDPDSPMVYLQTDTPINPGNSGGPLVDVNGAVVGLNTFIMSSTGGSEGLGFAIPSRIVEFIYQSLRKDGHVHHIEIGVLAQQITPPMAKALRLAQNFGVMITDVAPQGPAGVAGIHAEDIVLSVDGQPVVGLTGFTAALYQHRPDDIVKVMVLRGTEKRSFNVPAVIVRDRMDQLADLADPLKSHIGALGVLAVDFDSKLFPEVRLPSGALVIGVARGFNSTDTGLQPGDLIHSLNRVPIESTDQLKAAVSQLKTGQAAALQIERHGQFQYLAFEME
jgi:serine protease Do